jgi:hypothetical protein
MHLHLNAHTHYIPYLREDTPLLTFEHGIETADEQLYFAFTYPYR